ncbi:MAG: sensor histidine kinase [Actinobacteria bacterium]|nr:sensor histidine kinase [Actinomycetota bacterium]
MDERIAEERRDERARIAEALHDEVLQTLFNITIRAHVIKEDLRSGRLLDLDDDVPAVLEASERAVEEMRDVIRDLRRSPVGRAGLEDTLILLVKHLHDESGIRFVTTIGAVRAEASVQLLIYQIAREAMMNAVKHSGASTVWLGLSQGGGRIELCVEDDGGGFDPDITDERHFGLVLMRERAAAAMGELSIQSRPGEGTTVVVLLPQA